jgi:hypothetical protein
LAKAPAGWDRWQLLLEQIRSASAMPIRPAEHQLRRENIENIILPPSRLSKRENPAPHRKITRYRKQKQLIKNAEKEFR